MRRLILLTLLGLLATSPVRAEIECTASMADWQPVAHLVAAAAKLGWTVTKVRADDGCYHVHATDKAGKTVEAVFDPVSLKLLGRSDEDQQHTHDQADGHDAAAHDTDTHNAATHDTAIHDTATHDQPAKGSSD